MISKGTTKLQNSMLRRFDLDLKMISIRVVVFQTTFNNISVKLWRSVLLVKCRKPPTHFITYCCIEYTSPLVGLKLTTLVVIATDCTGSKSNYHAITTTIAL